MLACKVLQCLKMLHVNDVNIVVSICDCSLIRVYALHTHKVWMQWNCYFPSYMTLLTYQRKPFCFKPNISEAQCVFFSILYWNFFVTFSWKGYVAILITEHFKFFERVVCNPEHWFLRAPKSGNNIYLCFVSFLFLFLLYVPFLFSEVSNIGPESSSSKTEVREARQLSGCGFSTAELGTEHETCKEQASCCFYSLPLPVAGMEVARLHAELEAALISVDWHWPSGLAKHVGGCRRILFLGLVSAFLIRQDVLAEVEGCCFTGTVKLTHLQQRQTSLVLRQMCTWPFQMKNLCFPLEIDLHIQLFQSLWVWNQLYAV